MLCIFEPCLYSTSYTVVKLGAVQSVARKNVQIGVLGSVVSSLSGVLIITAKKKYTEKKIKGGLELNPVH